MFRQFLQQTSNKYIGMKQIYHYIHQDGPITKSKLKELTGMTQTTVTRHLEALIEEGFIRVGQYEESSGGRPPALYEVEPKTGFIIGIDISRIRSTITLMDLTFQQVDSYSFSMTETHTPDKTITLLKEKAQHFMKKYHISQQDLLGIGVGTVGPLDREKGLILRPEAFIASGWKNVPIVEELEKTFDTKVVLENGANVATLHEYIKDPVQNQTILYSISGRGLRCGVLTDGHIMQNKTGDASSFGDMILDIHNGKSLTSLISYDFLLEEMGKRMTDNNSISFLEDWDQLDKMNQLDRFFQALQKGDPVLQDIVLQSAYSYGVGLANMINVLHPEQVVLNSELIKRYPDYFEKVVQTAKQFINSTERQLIHFKKANRMENSITIGAAALIFQSYF
ncbi:ROK family transcriptional regulator [Gracilibacillus sp. YIM 98692]|uniref:ROK family transcriptional regulator n=1 Tax=Gracilibacillus sp. YIM 98692 TaxID=2663532 RepID=UPI0013CF9264|nr:ROK family transcriptional regulator [Gracilibacillus sp. YIM 98692]